MKLVEDWKCVWRYFSVQANTIGSAVALGYASMYEQLKENFPPRYMVILTAAVFLLGIIGRVISQEPKNPEDKE